MIYAYQDHLFEGVTQQQLDPLPSWRICHTGRSFAGVVSCPICLLHVVAVMHLTTGMVPDVRTQCRSSLPDGLCSTTVASTANEARLHAADLVLHHVIGLYESVHDGCAAGLELLSQFSVHESHVGHTQIVRDIIMCTYHRCHLACHHMFA